MSMSKAINIADLRRLARRRLPRMVFDYIDGGADDEVTLARATHRYRDYELIWRSLVDVAAIDTSIQVMGSSSASPIIISPTAASRLFHPVGGEGAVARAASAHGAIYSISTLGSTTIEDIAPQTRCPKWFQIYVWRDRSLMEETLERVRKAGFDAIILTVDAAVAGNRERDPRNGFSIPPKVNSKSVTQALMRPGYLFDLARTAKIGPVNFPQFGDRDQDIMSMINTLFDRSVTWDYVSWLRSVWEGPIAIKGILSPDDARRAVDCGANAVWISNHGGRQLDTAIPTIDALGAIAEAVGSEVDVILDGGIRRGSDVVKALALGANAVAIGRAYLYGLAAGGEAGVARALEILMEEVKRTMALLGAPDIAALSPEMIVARRAR